MLPTIVWISLKNVEHYKQGRHFAKWFVPTVTTCTGSFRIMKAWILKQSDTAKILSSATVLLWDQASMAHYHAYEAFDRTVRDLTGVDFPFGEKIVILGGDFRQVFPTVLGGTRAQQIDACVVQSYLRSAVKVFHLTQNMRARYDQSYADFILCVGNGNETNIQEDMLNCQRILL